MPLVMSLICAMSSVTAMRGGYVLAARGDRGRDVAVGTGEGQYLGGIVLGQAVGEAFAASVDDFGNAGDLDSGADVVAGHQHMYITYGLGSGGHAVDSRAFD